ncbi:hypothetical protein RJG79_05060 [Mycoplasmatota bacterium WC44]
MQCPFRTIPYTVQRGVNLPPNDVKPHATNFPVHLQGENINKGCYPTFNYQPNNSYYPCTYVPIPYFSKIGADIDWDNKLNSLTISSDYFDIKKTNETFVSKMNDLETEIKSLKLKNNILSNNYQTLKNFNNTLNDENLKLKQEVNRLKSLPPDIPYETLYDHIFSSNSEFYIYYGKKKFTGAVEENKDLKQLINTTQSDGLRINWVYYPSTNQMYFYVSFINQRLGLNNYDSDEIRRLIGNSYRELHKEFNKITKDNTIKLEMSFVFSENSDGYNVQRSIYVNEDDIEQFPK